MYANDLIKLDGNSQSSLRKRMNTSVFHIYFFLIQKTKENVVFANKVTGGFNFISFVENLINCSYSSCKTRM